MKMVNDILAQFFDRDQINSQKEPKSAISSYHILIMTILVEIIIKVQG